MTAVYVRKAPDAERAKDATIEIARLQEIFELNRIIGSWTSPYPQVGYSKVLGCQVREVRAKDMIR